MRKIVEKRKENLTSNLYVLRQIKNNIIIVLKNQMVTGWPW